MGRWKVLSGCPSFAVTQTGTNPDLEALGSPQEELTVELVRLRFVVTAIGLAKVRQRKTVACSCATRGDDSFLLPFTHQAGQGQIVVHGYQDGNHEKRPVQTMMLD